MNKKQFFALFLSASLLTVSCSKDETPAAVAPVATQPKTVAPNYPANDGMLQLVNTVTIMSNPLLGGDLGIDVYTAAATISDGNGGFLNVGDVTVEGKKLAMQANNSYVYTDIVNPINPSGVADWVIAGGSGFGNASVASSTVVPELVSVTKPTEVNLSGASFKIDSKSESKILVVLSGGNGESVVKEFNAGTINATFSKDELAKLTATTNGFVQITPYNYVVRNVNSKDIVVGNQSTYSYTGVTFK